MVEWCIPLWVTLTLTLTSDLISRFFVCEAYPILQLTFLKYVLCLTNSYGGIRRVTVTFLVFRQRLLYPRYEVYRGYIVFAFSVIMFVCLSVNCFFVKNFSATTWVRILKFGKKLYSDELYCVTKNSHILLISPFICSFFFLSNGNFCHRFLSSYWSQCFKILCTPSGR